MERIGFLINKLKEQYEKAESSYSLLITLQMLQRELQPKADGRAVNNNISVTVPGQMDATFLDKSIGEKFELDLRQNAEGKQVFELEIPKTEIEEITPNVAPAIVTEVNEVLLPPKKVYENVQAALPFQDAAYMPPPVFPGPVHTKNEANLASGELKSVNDILDDNVPERMEAMQEEPIADLKKEISINDKFRYISQLFMGDENMYEGSIRTVNNFQSFSEAKYWISRELALKLGWQDSDELVQQFMGLVRRRYL